MPDALDPWNRPVSLPARWARRAVRLTLRPVFARTDWPLQARRRYLLRLSKLMGLALPRRLRIEPVSLGGVPAERLSGPRPGPGALLYLHGGAYVLGAPAVFRPLTAALALGSGRSVVVPDYRLAPEHPYPAAVDDAVAAYRALLDEQPAERIAVGGDSAGGGLTLALLLALRERGLPLPGAAFVISPWGDVRCLAASHADPTIDDPLLIPEVLRDCGRQYAAGQPPDTPGISPLAADLSGLPPLLIQATTGEVLVDDARALAERVQAAGGTVRLEIWPDLWHDWQLFTPWVPEAKAAVARLCDFLADPRP